MYQLIENLSGMIKVVMIDESAALKYAGLVDRAKLTLKPIVEIIQARIV